MINEHLCYRVFADVWRLHEDICENSAVVKRLK